MNCTDITANDRVIKLVVCEGADIAQRLTVCTNIFVEYTSDAKVPAHGIYHDFFTIFVEGKGARPVQGISLKRCTVDGRVLFPGACERFDHAAYRVYDSYSMIGGIRP